MSALEHRMQLLLDERRVTLLRERAAERGVSVSTVVRDAIDASFEDDAMTRRAEAARELLAITADNVHREPPEEPDAIANVRDAMDDELIAKAERW